jgi:hypothetical protein
VCCFFVTRGAAVGNALRQLYETERFTPVALWRLGRRKAGLTGVKTEFSSLDGGSGKKGASNFSKMGYPRIVPALRFLPPLD